MNSFTLINNTPDLITEILNGVARAKESVRMQFMSFEGDSTGWKFAQALLDARKRGCKVYLTFDSYTDLILSDKQLFLPHWPHVWYSLFQESRSTTKMVTTLQEAGVQVTKTNPFSLLRPWRFAHHDHRKMVLIDSEIAYVGGFNVSDHNASWHDTGVVIRDTATIRALIQIFDKTVQNEPLTPDIAVSEQIRIMQTNEGVMQELERLAKQAKKSIFIESGYYRSSELTEHIAQAVEKSVSAGIIVPYRNNQGYVQWKQNKLCEQYPDLFYQRVKPSKMSHAKLALLDDIVVFGSSNFEPTPLDELTLFVQDTDLAEQVHTYFKTSIAHSVKTAKA